MLLVGIALISTFAITRVHLNQLYNSEVGVKILQTDGLGGWQLVTQSASSLDFSPANVTEIVGIPLIAEGDNLVISDPTKFIVTITSTGNQNITGFDNTNVQHYKIYTFINKGNDDITLRELNNNSNVGNQFLGADDIRIKSKTFWQLYYDPILNGWIGLAKP